MSSNNPFDELSENNIYKDRKQLKTTTTPEYEDFKEREEQIRKMTEALRDIKNSSSEHLVLTGNVGAGKTAAANMMVGYLQESFNSNNIKKTYISDVRTEKDTLAQISQKLNLSTERSKGEYYKGNDFGTYYQLIKQKVTEENIDLVIILDELEKLYEKQEGNPSEEGNEVIKKLYELSKEIENEYENCCITIIAISNEARVDDSFNERVDSRINGEIINFSEYNANELRSILNARKEKALKNGAVEEGVISKCAAKAASQKGDARKALRILRKAGDLARKNGDNSISKDYVDQAVDAIERRNILKTVTQMNKKTRIVFYFLIEYKKHLPATSSETDYYYNRFLNSVESIEKGFKEDYNMHSKTLKKYIKTLRNRGLVEAPLENAKSGRGRTRRISLCDISDKLAQDIQEEIEDISTYKLSEVDYNKRKMQSKQN